LRVRPSSEAVDVLDGERLVVRVQRVRE
jgi:hypothetical protein